MSFPGPSGPPPPPYIPHTDVPEHLPVIEASPAVALAAAPDRDPLAVAGLIAVLATAIFIGTYAWSYWDLAADFSFDDDFDESAVDRLRAVSNVINPLFVGTLLVGVALASARGALGLTGGRVPSAATRAAKTIGGIFGILLAVGGIIAAVDVAFVRDVENSFFTPNDERWQTAVYHLTASAIGFATLYLAAWQPDARRTGAFVAPVPSDHGDHSAFGAFD
jgi:hypothetical protein